MLVLFGALFLAIGLFLGISIGDKRGMNSCAKDVHENIVFRNIIEDMVKIKNSNKFRRNKIKLIYENLDTLYMFMNNGVES